MPNPATDPVGAYWADGSGGATTLSAADLNARETIVGASFVLPMSSPGTLATGAGAAGFRMPFHAKLLSVTATVGTPPSGSAVTVDVNRNRFTVFTTQSNRPSVLADAVISDVVVPDLTAFAAGDLVSVDIDAVGSTNPGSDLTVVLVFQGATTGPSQTYQDVIGVIPGLKAYWKLDEPSGTAAADALGNAPGTYAATPTLNKTPLIVDGGKSVGFSRASIECVQISMVPGFSGLTSCTFLCWVKPASQPTSGQFFTLGAKAQSLESATWGMDYRNTGGTLQLAFYVRTDANPTTEHVVTQTLSNGTTYMLAGTWDGADLRLFVNGSQIGTTTACTGTMVDTTAGMTIAAYNVTAPSDSFDGDMDAVSFWANRALTATNLTAIRNKGLSG